MYFGPKNVTLKDGRPCTLRSALPEDAQALLDHMKALSGESDFMLRYPDECTLTPETEREVIANHEASQHHLLLVAVVDGAVVGSVGVYPHAEYDKYDFRGRFGLGVRKDFWRLGVGSALLEGAISSAKEIGFTQMELEVNGANERAIPLYERLGFKKYSDLPRGSRLRDGTYYAEYSMVLPFTPCEEPRLARFEAALAALQQRREENERQLSRLKAEGKEKTVRYRELLGQKLTDGYLLDHFKQFGL